MIGFHKGRCIRKHGAYLGRRCRASMASPLAVTTAGPHPYIGDQHRAPGCSLLDQIEHVASVQHRKVGVLLVRSTSCRTMGRAMRCKGA
jgi:hypothetical protein